MFRIFEPITILQQFVVFVYLLGVFLHYLTPAYVKTTYFRYLILEGILTCPDLLNTHVMKCAKY